MVAARAARGAAAGAGGDEEGELAAVEITFVDPQSGSVRSRDVFCDATDWQKPRQSRFLISSDLVNLLSDAVAQRTARFRQRHDQLARYRFGYQCVLWRLRNDANRLADMMQTEEEEAEGACSNNTADEVCPIHFYRPECYLDEWTYERLQMATRMYKDLLLADIAELEERIRELGGSGWYDILRKMCGRVGEGGETSRCSSPSVSPKSFGGTSPKSVRGGMLSPASAMPEGYTSPADLLASRRPKKKPPPTVDVKVVADRLLAVATDEDRKNLENKLSGGLRDMHDQLEPIVEALEPEFADCAARSDEVQLDLRQKTATIKSCQDKLQEIAKKLEAPPPHIPPDSESEPEEEVKPPDDSAFWDRVSGLIRQLLEEWAAKIREAQARAAKARESADAWEAKWKAFDGGDMKKLREEVKDLEASLAKWQAKSDKLAEKARAVREKTQEKIREAAEQQRELDELQAKLAAVPPPSPASMRYQNMLKDLERLIAHSNKLKDNLKNPEARVKAIRYQLKKLYNKMGWEWEFSDSEGDEDDKPYWVRRKLASEGMAKFDPNDFLNAERTFHKKRLRTMAKKESQKEETAILNRMVAARHLHSETVANMLKKMEASRADGQGPDEMGPFKADGGDLKAVDSVGHAMENVRSSLLGRSSEDARSRSPRTAAETSQIQAYCARLIQLQELRGACLKQLRHEAECLPELLPDEGMLAEPRARLSAAVMRLVSGTRFESDFLDEDEEVESELEDICSSIQEAIEDAIRVSDRVGSIKTALQHSLRFSELHEQLASVLAERSGVLADLRAMVGDDALASCSTRLPSFQVSVCEPSTSTWLSSASNSPRPRATATRPSGEVPAPSRQGPRGPPSGSPPPYPRGLETVVGSSAPGSGTAGGSAFLSPLSAADGTRQRSWRGDGSRFGRSPEVVDFGFRPDGVGEESVENWSLFKVSNSGLSAQEVVASPSPGGARAAAGDKLGRLSDPKAARLQQRLAAHCDFREYVSQQRESSKELWQSASAPELVKKGGPPSLPQLVKREQAQQKSSYLPPVDRGSGGAGGGSSPATKQGGGGRAQIARSKSGTLNLRSALAAGAC